MYVRRPCTVAHGLTVRKEKERIAKKRCTGGVKEKKRNDPWETRTRDTCAYQAGRHPTKLRCAFAYGSLLYLGPFNVGTPPCPLRAFNAQGVPKAVPPFELL